MTAPVRQQDVRLAETRFIERCRAKALAWQAGEISLHDAVDGLQQAAEAYGLVIELGQDAVQALMVEAFAPLRTDLPPRDEHDGSTFAAACDAADAEQRRKPSDPRIERARRLMSDHVSFERAWHELSERAPDDVPIATLKAAGYLIRAGDEAGWRKWFDAHTAQEQKAILDHLEARRRRRK
jgi:hypothetical protein